MCCKNCGTENNVKKVGGWLLFAALAVIAVCSFSEFISSAKNLVEMLKSDMLRFTGAIVFDILLSAISVKFGVIAIVWFCKIRNGGTDKKFFLFFSLAVSFFAIATLNDASSLYYALKYNSVSGISGLYDHIVLPLLRFCVGGLTLAGCIMRALGTKRDDEGKSFFFRGILCPIAAFLAFEATSFNGGALTSWLINIYYSQWFFIFASVINYALIFFLIFSLLTQNRAKAGCLPIVMSAIVMSITSLAISLDVAKNIDNLAATFTSATFWVNVYALALYEIAFVLSIINLSARSRYEKSLKKGYYFDFVEKKCESEETAAD